MEINQETFFKIGMGCFLVIGVANLANLFYTWQLQNIFSATAAIGGIIFNFALFFFFRYLWNETREKITIEHQGEDVNQIIERIKKS